jgi:hypothetical protein
VILNAVRQDCIPPGALLAEILPLSAIFCRLLLFVYRIVWGFCPVRCRISVRFMV